MTLLRYAAVACLATAVGAGCGPSKIATVKLAGTVTLDGKPLSEGAVTFHPADKEGAASTSAPIVDGKYSAPAVAAGSYRASFSSAAALSSTAPAVVDSTYNAPTSKTEKNPIPEKYRRPSLPADATADNANLNFDLKSK